MLCAIKTSFLCCVLLLLHQNNIKPCTDRWMNHDIPTQMDKKKCSVSLSLSFIYVKCGFSHHTFLLFSAFNVSTVVFCTRMYIRVFLSVSAAALLYLSLSVYLFSTCFIQTFEDKTEIIQGI